MKNSGDGCTKTSMANSILLDANIILELFFQRAKYHRVIAELTLESDDSRFAVSILSTAFLMYHVEKENRSIQDAYNLLEGYEILDMNSADYVWAQANDQGDFEDALQLACALRHNCKKVNNVRQAAGKAAPQTHFNCSGRRVNQ